MRSEDAKIRGALAEDPTVLAIAWAVWTNAARCAPGSPVPEELARWAVAAARAREFAAARLAVLVLVDAGRMSAAEAAPLIIPAVRGVDLELLATHAADADARALWRDFSVSLAGLADELADAVLAWTVRREYFAAAELFLRRRDELAAAIPAMVGNVGEMVGSILRAVGQVADERAAAEPVWTRVLSQARGFDPGGLAPPRLEELTIGLIEVAIQRVGAMVKSEPWLALQVALLLLAWLPREEDTYPIRALAEHAVHAIIAAEAVQLLPRAEELVEYLLEHGGVRHSRAELLYYRVKVAMPAFMREPMRRPAALRMLGESVAGARREGAGWCEVKASCLWVTLRVQDLPPKPQRAGVLAEATALLDAAESAALAWELVPELCSERARVAMGAGDIAGSVAQWQRALDHTPTERHPAFRADLLANLAQAQMFGGRLDEAEVAARAAQEHLPTDSGVGSTAFVRGILGLVLAQHPREETVDEAIALLEDALRVPWQRIGLTHSASLRLALVWALRRKGQLVAARHHLDVVLMEHADLADVDILLDAVGRACDLDAIDGGNTAHPLVDRLVRHHEASPWHGTLELTRGLANDLRAVERLAHAYLAGELPRHPTVDELLRMAIDRQCETAPRALLAAYLDGGFVAARHVHLRGKILLALRRREQLRGELERELVEQQSDADRATRIAFLIATLPSRDPRRRAAIFELEALLHRTEQPHLRAQLASYLFEEHRGDPSVLRRAADHAEAAGRADPDGMEDLWRLRAGIRGAQMTASCAESSPRTVEIAAWFAQDIPLPRDEVDEMRLAMSRQLLFAGGLTHPDALEQAERFVTRIAGDEADELMRRIAWIRHQHAAPDGTRPVTQGRWEWPFDDAPGWLIDLAAGRRPRIQGRLTGEDAAAVLEAAPLRPDRAGEMMLWLVEEAGELLPELVHDIAALPLRGRDAGPRLFEVLAETIAARPQFALLKLEVLLRQGTREWGDGTPYERAADRLLAAAETVEQRAEAAFYKGIERLDAHQATQTDAAIRAAREHLATAEVLAGEHVLPGYLQFGILVSSGNAARRGVDVDPERALGYYERAAAIGTDSKHEEARLAKVRADALVERGRDEDAREALALLEVALRVRRSGWLRAETLVSAHAAELACSGGSEEDRARRALARLDEAAEHDDGSLAEPLVQLRLRVLDRLLGAAPRDKAALQQLDEIAAAHPDVAWKVKVIRLRSQLPGGMQRDHLVAFEFAKYTWAISGYMPNAAAAPGDPRAWAGERLTRLTPAFVAGHPARLAARATVCAYLCEFGDVDKHAAKAAVEAAVAAVDGVQETWERGFLLGELSRVFAPNNHWGHPLRDFPRAAAMCERGLALEDLPAMQRCDLLGYLARATRYRTDGDVRGHLLRAEKLYEQVVELHRKAGQEAEAGHTAANLAELRAMLQRGGERAARQVEIAKLRQVVTAANGVATLTDHVGLARELTLLGSATRGDEGMALLLEGEQAFAALPWAQLESGLADSASNYRTICNAELAARRGDIPGAIERWRARLAGIDRTRDAAAWSMAAHNYADLLLRVGGSAGRRHALDLCVAALAVRTREFDLLHHWETAFQLSQTAATLLEEEPRSLRRDTYEAAVAAMRSGLAAAEALGGGERRFRGGVSLLRLALHASGIAQLTNLAEEAWRHIDGGRPSLLADEAAGHIESDAALAVAEVLADRLGDQGLVGVAEACRYVLAGEAAVRVLPWISRAAGSAQRRLAARMHRPEQVPHATWSAWLTAVRGRDTCGVAQALEQIQTHAPGFLGGEPARAGLEAWLRDRPSAAAIAVLTTSRGLLAAILEWRSGLRVQVVRLAAPPPPCDEDTLTRSVELREYSELYRSVGAWAEQHVVGPLQRLVADGLRHLLWLPDGPVRMLSPRHLWPGVAVSLAIDLCVRAWSPPLATRTAILVADPDVPGVAIPEVVARTAELARLAASVGPHRVRLSRGERWGERLGVDLPGLVNGPASAEGLLLEIAEAEQVLLMCHGRATSPEDAELQMITADGEPEVVSIATIAADPRRIPGQTYILLSCETGRTGATLDRAGGVAGALLACGARQVLAPLWPVLSSVAYDVGAAALRAIAAGEDLATTLAGPAEAKSLADDVSRAGFVLWVA
jgi:tetratricopeptide (TPR) repeat protein